MNKISFRLTVLFLTISFFAGCGKSSTDAEKENHRNRNKDYESRVGNEIADNRDEDAADEIYGKWVAYIDISESVNNLNINEEMNCKVVMEFSDTGIVNLYIDENSIRECLVYVFYSELRAEVMEKFPSATDAQMDELINMALQGMGYNNISEVVDEFAESELTFENGKFNNTYSPYYIEEDIIYFDNEDPVTFILNENELILFEFVDNGHTVFVREESVSSVTDSNREGLRPEFLEAMDSYEAFYDEYIDMMKRYNNNPSDLTLLNDYVDLMEKATDMDEKFEAWENDESLSIAETRYLIEVSARIQSKLLSIYE